MINGETKVLLYLFGFILLLTGKLGEFLNESKMIEYVSSILGI
jgi:hypothetical protein